MKSLKLLLFLLLLTGCGQVGPSPKPGASASIPIIEESEPETPSDTMSSEKPISPKVYEVSDLVSYFNAKGEEEGIAVSYIEDKGYWYLHYMGEESDDESKDNLSLGVSSFLKYLPLYRVYEGGYMFKYLSKYIIDPEVYFVYVAVSSNHFAACSMYSYIEDSHLITDIIIYDGRNGLWS